MTEPRKRGGQPGSRNAAKPDEVKLIKIEVRLTHDWIAYLRSLPPRTRSERIRERLGDPPGETK